MILVFSHFYGGGSLVTGSGDPFLLSVFSVLLPTVKLPSLEPTDDEGEDSSKKRKHDQDTRMCLFYTTCAGTATLTISLWTVFALVRFRLLVYSPSTRLRRDEVVAAAFFCSFAAAANILASWVLKVGPAAASSKLAAFSASAASFAGVAGFLVLLLRFPGPWIQERPAEVSVVAVCGKSLSEMSLKGYAIGPLGNNIPPCYKCNFSLSNNLNLSGKSSAL